MPRSQRSGSRACSLVNIPLKRFRAVSPHGARLHLLNAADRGHLRPQPVRVLDGTEVPVRHPVRGYEIHPDQYVALGNDELEHLAPGPTRPIDQTCLRASDPVGECPSELLVRTIHTAGGIGSSPMASRTKQCLTALGPKRLAPIRETLFQPDEIVPETTLTDMPAADITPGAREFAMAGELVESLAGDFAPRQYDDAYSERLSRPMQNKRAGRKPPRPVSFAERSKVVSPMDTVETRIARTRNHATPARPLKRRRA